MRQCVAGRPTVHTIPAAMGRVQRRCVLLVVLLAAVAVLAQYDDYDVNIPSLQNLEVPIPLTPRFDSPSHKSGTTRASLRNLMKSWHTNEELNLVEDFGRDRSVPFPVLSAMKRTPAELNSTSSEDGSPRPRKWKKKKGKLIGYQMCYFKLCSFRPKAYYEPE